MVTNEKKDESKKFLPPDINESLLESIKTEVEKFWEFAWLDPKAETYNLPKYVCLSALGKTFINHYYNTAEGAFGMIRHRKKPDTIEIGIVSTSYGGIEGCVNKGLSIRTTAGRILPFQAVGRIHTTLESEIFPEMKRKGLEIYRQYLKRPQEKPPEVYSKGPPLTIKKYFFIGETDPWQYTQELMEIPEKMYDRWAQRLTHEVIKSASIQISYSNEFGLVVVKTPETTVNGVQKEARLRLEGVVELKDVGEVGEAIGCSGGIDSLIFYHPLTLKAYKGWMAIEMLGEWIADKAQAMLRAEKPEEYFKEKTVDVIIPGTVLIAAMSHFFSGKKMWESYKSQKSFQLHRLVGQKIAPENVSILLDGRQETAWGTNLYGSLEIDSEGTPATEKVIVDNGKLVRFFNSRLYFLPVAERTALADILLSEENPLTATARKEEVKRLPDTAPTNLYVKPESDLSLDGLVEKLGKQKTSLYAVSVSIVGVNTETGEIRMRVDQGKVIQAGKINHDLTVKNMILTLNFNAIPEKLKYIGGSSTLVSHAFNMEMDGSIYEISVTAPYMALFEVEHGEKRWYSNHTSEIDSLYDELFTSQHLYSQALPAYISPKRKYIEYKDEGLMPESLKNVGLIFQPILPQKFVAEKAKKLAPTKF
jgi:predicted Zn-dependent protease